MVGGKLRMDGGKGTSYRFPKLAGLCFAFTVSCFLWVLFFVFMLSLLHI